MLRLVLTIALLTSAPAISAPSLFVAGDYGFGLAESSDGLILNQTSYQGIVGVFWGTNQANRFGVGVGSHHQELSPRHEDENFETISWKTDQMIGNGYTLRLVYEMVSSYIALDILSGKFRLPSRVAHTDEQGFRDISEDRGRYSYTAFGLEFAKNFFQWGPWITSGSVSLSQFGLSGGGACTGYDADCGDDFLEGDTAKFNSMTFKLSTSLWFEKVFGQ